MSTSYLFSFAAKSLQNYIMRGGKLRDMVGATSLIDKLSSKTQLTKWLADSFAIDGGRFEILQAAAGSARIRFFEKEDAESVHGLWPLLCQAWAPGLDVVQDLQTWEAGRSYGEIAKAAGKALEKNRNFPAPRMPEAGPFVRRAPRVGEPAVELDHALEKELTDAAAVRKRKEREELGKGQMVSELALSFGFSDANNIPEDFSQISGGGTYLAVVHADGNRLGQMFLKVGKALEACPPELDEEVIALFRFLSETVVAEGTRAAVKTAVDSLPEKAMPASGKWLFAPIVLAGDDVTVVCRADLALQLTTAFLKAFREEMKSRLSLLREQDFWDELPEAVREGIPTELSAGAGIVFCADHYPFSLAYELCEDLAGHAKKAAKARAGGDKTPPSAISFVRISGASAPAEFADLAEGILKGSDGSLLTGCPYFVEPEERPCLQSLVNLFETARPRIQAENSSHKQLGGLPTTSLRELLNLQRTDMDQVPLAAKRMKEIAGGLARNGERKTQWVAFESAWVTLCGGTAQDWNQMRFDPAVQRYISSGGEECVCSPLLDLITLLAIRDKLEDQVQTLPELKPALQASS